MWWFGSFGCILCVFGGGGVVGELSLVFYDLLGFGMLSCCYVVLFFCCLSGVG